LHLHPPPPRPPPSRSCNASSAGVREERRPNLAAVRYPCARARSSAPPQGPPHPPPLEEEEEATAGAPHLCHGGAPLPTGGGRPPAKVNRWGKGGRRGVMATPVCQGAAPHRGKEGSGTGRRRVERLGPAAARLGLLPTSSAMELLVPLPRPGHHDLPSISSSFAPSRGGCLRGERRCNFASPLSCEGSLPHRMPSLLEAGLDRHSRQREAKMHLPPPIATPSRTTTTFHYSPTVLSPAARLMPSQRRMLSPKTRQGLHE
jgi:hypothetical protein